MGEINPSVNAWISAGVFHATILLISALHFIVAGVFLSGVVMWCLIAAAVLTTYAICLELWDERKRKFIAIGSIVLCADCIAAAGLYFF